MSFQTAKVEHENDFNLRNYFKVFIKNINCTELLLRDFMKFFYIFNPQTEYYITSYYTGL